MNDRNQKVIDLADYMAGSENARAEFCALPVEDQGEVIQVISDRRALGRTLAVAWTLIAAGYAVIQLLLPVHVSPLLAGLALVICAASTAWGASRWWRMTRLIDQLSS